MENVDFDAREYLRSHPIDVPEWATSLKGFPRKVVIMQFLAALLFGIAGVADLLTGVGLRRSMLVIAIGFTYGVIGWLARLNFRSWLRFQYVAESYIEQLLNNTMFHEQESEKARAAANVRHEANRKRKAEAREQYKGRKWATKTAAIKTLAVTFHVTPKTVERWISSWDKE